MKVLFYVFVAVMAVSGLYFPYYSLSNPELTQTQVLLNNLWNLPITVGSALSVVWMLRKYPEKFK